MESRFPGFDNYKMEKKVSDIENSITNSLIDSYEVTNSNININNIPLCYKIATVFIISSLGLVIYACVNLLLN